MQQKQEQHWLWWNKTKSFQFRNNHYVVFCKWQQHSRFTVIIPKKLVLVKYRKWKVSWKLQWLGMGRGSFFPYSLVNPYLKTTSLNPYHGPSHRSSAMGKLGAQEELCLFLVPHPSAVKHPFPNSQLYVAALVCPCHVREGETQDPQHHSERRPWVELLSTQGIGWQHNTISICAVDDTGTGAAGTALMVNHGTSLQSITRCVAQHAEQREIKSNLYVSYEIVKRQQLSAES